MKIIVKRDDTIFISEREIKYVEMLSLGKNVGDISREVGVNKRTLEFHLNKMRYQLGCNNLTHLVAKFIREGIIK